jgi:hypothetical protein
VLWLFWGFLCVSPYLCRLRTEGLVPVSKYWMYRSDAGDMGPVSLVVCHQQVLGLSALHQWLCWQRNWDSSHRPLSRAERWCREHFFSGAVHLSNHVDDSWRVATYGYRPQEAYIGHTWTGMGSVRTVLVGFSPAECTSIRITATLEYEYPLVRGYHQVILYGNF